MRLAAGKFKVLYAEALDRISRNQEDIAAIYKRLSFAGVKIVTLSEGEISHLHIGLKGTMNALFLKDLADKTRRGLRGRVEAGMSGGGKCYGFDVVPGDERGAAPSTRSSPPLAAASLRITPPESRPRRQRSSSTKKA